MAKISLELMTVLARHKYLRRIAPSIKDMIINCPDAWRAGRGVVSYARAMGQRWEEGEHLLMKEPWLAYRYADEVIHGRWPEGEATIALDPGASLSYAEGVLQAAFPLGEKSIATDGEYSYHYANDVLMGPFPEGEAAIKKSTLRYDYAYRLLNMTMAEAAVWGKS